MQHFLNLDKCTCGAYRYLAVREHKRSYEVYLIHHSHTKSSSDQRKYSKLASIPKYKLNIHDQRADQQEQERTISLTIEQTTALKSLLKELDAMESTVTTKESERVLSDTPAPLVA
jgi:hypothetical protein